MPAEDHGAVRRIAATKSTAELPAFDLTFDKDWISPSTVIDT
jgi:hypothetical protein